MCQQFGAVKKSHTLSLAVGGKPESKHMVVHQCPLQPYERSCHLGDPGEGTAEGTLPAKVTGKQPGVQSLDQIFAQSRGPQTNLSKSREESVHHRRLPVDGLPNAVTFRHSVTEGDMKGLQEGSTRVCTLPRALGRRPSSPQACSLYQEQSRKEKQPATSSGGEPDQHVTCRTACGLSFLLMFPGPHSSHWVGNTWLEVGDSGPCPFSGWHSRATAHMQTSLKPPPHPSGTSSCPTNPLLLQLAAALQALAEHMPWALRWAAHGPVSYLEEQIIQSAPDNPTCSRPLGSTHLRAVGLKDPQQRPGSSPKPGWPGCHAQYLIQVSGSARIPKNL